MLLYRAAFTFSVVIFKAQVCDELLTFQVTQGVLELHRLDKQIVFRIKPRSRHRRLQVEAEPLLHADTRELIATFSQIKEQDQVQRNRRRQN